MKLVCHYLNVPLPHRVVVRGAEDSASMMSRLPFPLIVKHPNTYDSIGLTPASRIQTVAEVEAHIDRMTYMFGRALVEEFIDGQPRAVVADQPLA